MNVQILARPDHSLYLYDYLKKVIDVQLITFNVAKKNTLLHKLRPGAKLVDDEVRILYDFTIYAQAIFKLGKLGLINPYKWESRYSEHAYKRAASKYNADIIHYWPIYCHKFIREQRKRKNIPTVADVYCAHPYHILDIIQPEYDRYNLDIRTSYFYKDAQRTIEFLEHESNIITASHYTKESFLRYNPGKNIFMAGYGCMGNDAVLQTYDNALANRQKRSSPVLSIVYVGTVSVEKGLPYLLAAVKKMRSKSVQLDIIGPVVTGQEKVFKQYSSLDGINFLGFKSNREIKNTLWKYSLMVMPSLTDAYSLAVIEGLQNALPVIVTHNTGNKDDIEKFQVGKTIPATNIDALVEAIEKLMDIEYRDHLSANIRTFILDDMKYPYPLKVLDIYNTLLAGQKLT